MKERRKLIRLLSHLNKPALIISEDNLLAQKMKKYLKRYYGSSLIISSSDSFDDNFINLLRVFEVQAVIDIRAIDDSCGCSVEVNLTNTDIPYFRLKSNFDDNLSLNEICVPALVGFNEDSNRVEYYDGKRFSNEIIAYEGLCLADDFSDSLSKFIYRFDGYKPFSYINNVNSKVEKIVKKQQYCSVKYLYKTKPDRVIDNINIAEFRISMGERLAEEISDLILSTIDFIVPVPSSGNFYAVGVSKQTGIPYLPALSKVDVSKRAFEIQDVNMRKRFLSENMRVNSELVRDKNVLLVDEAIFTGATLKSVCELLISSGVKSLSVAIPSPWCFEQCSNYVQPKRKLLLEKIHPFSVANYFSAESITQLSFEKYHKVIKDFKGDSNFCIECFENRNGICTP